MDTQDILNVLGLSDENMDTDFEIVIKMEVGLKCDASQDSVQVESAPNQPVEIDNTFTIPLSPNDMSVENACLSEKVTDAIKANIIAQLASMVENAKTLKQKGSKAQDSESESFCSNKKDVCGIMSDNVNSNGDDSWFSIKREQLMDMICNELDTVLNAADNSENISIIQQVKQENIEDSETENEDQSSFFPAESSIVISKHGYNTRSRKASTIQTCTVKEEPKESVSTSAKRSKSKCTSSGNEKNIDSTNVSKTNDQSFSGSSSKIELTQESSEGPNKLWTQIPKESVSPSAKRSKSKCTSSGNEKNIDSTNVSKTNDQSFSGSSSKTELTQESSEGPNKLWTQIPKESVSPSAKRSKSKCTSSGNEKNIDSTNVSKTNDQSFSGSSSKTELTQESSEGPNKLWTQIDVRSSILQTGTNKCKICGKCFKSTSLRQLDPHLRFHDIKRFFCNICCKGFSSSNHIKDHVRKHIGKKQFACTICGVKFTTKYNLKSHVERCHSNPSEQKKYMKCGECGKTFSKKLMWRHKRIHSREIHYECDYCGKSFRTRCSLINHIEIHMDISYVCDVCGQIFRMENSLKKHMICHQEEFRCETCGATLDSFDSFQHHLKQHKQKHVCDICGAQLSNSISLNFHMTVHSGEKAFICDTCGRSFARRQNMETHIKLHLGIYKYECNICRKKFSQKWNLRKHTESCHKDIVNA